MLPRNEASPGPSVFPMGDACGGLGLAAFLEPHGGEKGGIAIKIKPEKLNSGSGCIICEYAKTPSIVKD